MFEGLISILEVPSLYQKTRVPFWNDKYISQQMLKAHLDPNFDGASRKLDFINKSVNWINKIAPPQKYKSLLDMGCGPGIYAEKFATSGYKVTGIDFSKHSIANSHFPRPAGPHFPASQGHIKRSALEIGRARGAPPC